MQPYEAETEKPTDPSVGGDWCTRAGRFSLPATLCGVFAQWQEVGRVVLGHCGEPTPGCVEVSGLWQKVRFFFFLNSSSNMKVHRKYNNNHKNKMAASEVNRGTRQDGKPGVHQEGWEAGVGP